MNASIKRDGCDRCPPAPQVSRRGLLTGAASLGAAAVLGTRPCVKDAAGAAAATKGRIKQSLVQWCFEEYWNLDELCRFAKQLGCKSIELVPPKDWPTLKKHGLICAITSSHTFVRGMNNPKHWDECLSELRKAIDVTAAAGFPNVITFTGYADTTNEGGSKVDAETGAKNCVEGFKKIVGYAEKKKITLCLEILNTRADDHPMKGHPGYQGNHADYCLDIVQRVGSPRLKLLFDIYHVQIMDGDVIRRIRQFRDAIGHVHVAGNPGRGELDDNQEINFPPAMRTLLEIGYQGYVGQEFIPTRDPKEGLRQAVSLCDV